MREAPPIGRKRVLSAFIQEVKPDRILYSEHFEDGSRLFKQACNLGLEGVVSKHADSKYKPKKTSWLKAKCQKTDELTIIGYVLSGKTNISALRLGRANGSQFDYVGKVGRGFTRSVSEILGKQLDRMVILKPSLTERLWLSPT